ncbi:MAG TPA: MgtC/SapB family protein [Bryobacteraceae bacterium]
MPIHLGWSDIAVRLALTVLAGTLIGINRTERGRPAGLRTTLLVCLAASVAMIQANLLMATAGKTGDSFITLDLMRLPLGILSGMGFIGAGAIVRRDNLVVGITTAATLWFVTVIGLCFGGGQLRLGLAALALGLAVLWGLKWFEQITKRDRRAELTVVTTPDGPSEKNIRACVAASDRVVPLATAYRQSTRYRRLGFDISWRARPAEPSVPRFVEELAKLPGVVKVDWRPQ